MASFTTSDGVRLDYTEAGPRTGRPVVLVAGFRAPATSWRFQVRALVRAGHRVIAWDRRGHGASEATDRGATMQRHGQDLRELLEHLDLREAVLVGGSMGGNVIWSTVYQYGTDRIAGIAVVDQTPRMLNDESWTHGFYDYDASNRDTLFATAVPDPGRFPLRSKGPVRIARLLLAMRGDRRLDATSLALMRDHAAADWRGAVASADVPVLFLAGAQSEFWPSDHAAAAAALAPRGRAVVIERAGHPANVEQPRSVNRELLGFLVGV